MTPTSTWYLILAAMLFSIGGVGMLVRRNVIVMFMCVELMLNAVNLSFVAFSTQLKDVGGQVSVFFVLVVAAAEVAIGLALIVAVFRRRRSGATASNWLSILRKLATPLAARVRIGPAEIAFTRVPSGPSAMAM